MRNTCGSGSGILLTRVGAARAAGLARSFNDTAEGARIDLRVTPGNVGLNTVTVKLEDLRGRTIDNANEVRVRLRFLEDDLAEPTQSLADLGNGTPECSQHHLHSWPEFPL